MSYSAMAHALTGYVEGHLERFDIRSMSECFGFSQAYLRELFLKNMDMPILQYYRRRRLITSASKLLHSDRRIIDIALESGFSSHEAYTRAFRKHFGMPPSQFRLVRPSIGRRQLGAGMFGLERIADEEKRSSGLMTEQNEKSTVLYGIRKVEQGAYGSNTMYPICVKAVSEYLGDDVSYAYIMAATGAAFRLVWNPPAQQQINPSRFCFSMFFMPLLPAYGLPYIIWERADKNVANQMPEEQRRIGKEWDHGSCFEHR